MTKEELQTALKAINVRIDRLIIAGKSYARESAEHARILRVLR